MRVYGRRRERGSGRERAVFLGGWEEGEVLREGGGTVGSRRWAASGTMNGSGGAGGGSGGGGRDRAGGWAVVGVQGHGSCGVGAGGTLPAVP